MALTVRFCPPGTSTVWFFGPIRPTNAAFPDLLSNVIVGNGAWA